MARSDERFATMEFVREAAGWRALGSGSAHRVIGAGSPDNPPREWLTTLADHLRRVKTHRAQRDHRESEAVSDVCAPQRLCHHSARRCRRCPGCWPSAHATRPLGRRVRPDLRAPVGVSKRPAPSRSRQTGRPRPPAPPRPGHSNPRARGRTQPMVWARTSILSPARPALSMTQPEPGRIQTVSRTPQF